MDRNRTPQSAIDRAHSLGLCTLSVRDKLDLPIIIDGQHAYSALSIVDKECISNFSKFGYEHLEMKIKLSLNQ